MLWLEMLLAATAALPLSLVLVLVFRWERPAREGFWASFVFVFILMTLFTWAAGVWLSPFGPRTWNLYWAPFGLSALVLALILAAVIPPHRRWFQRTRDEAYQLHEVRDREGRPPMTVWKAFGLWFWVLAIALIIAIAAHYLTER